MGLNINSISISEFCDLQGVDQADKFVLLKKYKSDDNKSYDKWYETISKEFRLSDKKTFETSKKTSKNN